MRLIKEMDPVVLHGYTSAAGDLMVRRSIKEYIEKTYEVTSSEDLIYLTVGAAASLTISLNALLNEGDEVISSELEHHSSVLPWLNLENKKKIKVKYIPLNEEGRITEFAEKPKVPKSNQASMGIYIFKWSVLKEELSLVVSVEVNFSSTVTRISSSFFSLLS